MNKFAHTCAIVIYALTDPRDEAVRYVGKTRNLKLRMYAHKHDKRRTHKFFWLNSLFKEGLTPGVIILQELTTEAEEQWRDAEAFWINKYKAAGERLTNLMEGGYGITKHSELSKAKMAESQRNLSPEKRANQSQGKLGIKQTAEHVINRMHKLRGLKRTAKTRANISAGLKGHNVSASTRSKLRIINTGRKLPASTIEKIRQASTGRTHSQESIQRMREAKTGHSVSKATRVKLSKARKGVPWTEIQHQARKASIAAKRLKTTHHG